MASALRRHPYPSARNDRISDEIQHGRAVAIPVAEARTLTAAQLGIKAFIGVRCERCKAGLHDAVGNPRWDFVDGRFVCREVCRG